ncbi:MAG: hypothetical protein KDA24_05920 [Deltaproteobacteria bacterium]|nr:hypothetical protein [Deltaproteobacteria bacterium]
MPSLHLLPSRASTLLALAVLAGCPSAEPGPSNPGDIPTELGGDRPAAFQVPADYDGLSPLPLLMLLGGYDYLSADLDEWLGVSEHPDDLNVALLMPDGLIDSGGSPFWNATDTCCDYDGTGVDDVAYLEGLITEAGDTIPLDASRVVLVGHSNGGFMAYRMACEADTPVTALVSIAGSGWLDPDDCDATEPVSVLQVHGEDDEIMPFAGDTDAPGALEMLERWAGRNDCTTNLESQGDGREYADDGIDDETAVSRYSGCGGQDAELWLMEGNDHYPEFRPLFTTAALDWGLARPRE